MSEVPLDVLTDYTDGYDRMKDVLRRLSTSAIISYGDEAGPILDELYSERTFYQGMRDSLVNQVCLALDRSEIIASDWLLGRTVHRKESGGEVSYILVEGESVDSNPVSLGNRADF